MTFILENKLQKEYFLAKYDSFFSELCVHFEPLLRWECAYVCHDIKTEKEEIYNKQREYKTSNWHSSDGDLGK